MCVLLVLVCRVWGFEDMWIVLFLAVVGGQWGYTLDIQYVTRFRASRLASSNHSFHGVDIIYLGRQPYWTDSAAKAAARARYIHDIPRSSCPALTDSRSPIKLYGSYTAVLCLSAWYSCLDLTCLHGFRGTENFDTCTLSIEISDRRL